MNTSFDPHDSKTIGYHLFLEPNEVLGQELAKDLESIIQDLADEYHSPVFKPHVTLLARIVEDDERVVLSKAQEIANSLLPFSVTLGELNAEDAYFRALYIKIVDKQELQNAHAKANEIFAMKDTRSYVPHISLLYGNYFEETKEKTIQSLQYPKGKEFIVDRIHIYKTEGEAENWVKIGESVIKN